MSVSSYPRVTIQGTGNLNNPQNGLGLMIYNPTSQRYEAATAATFGGGGGGGGDATAANQTTQINLATTANNNFTASTNNGVLTDILGSRTLSGSFVQLPSQICKYVTLVNLSTNVFWEFNINNTGANFRIEAGYSVRVNVNNANLIFIRQATGEAQTAQYIVTT
jgi:hypothetical protein